MNGGGRYQRMAQEASGIPHSSELDERLARLLRLTELDRFRLLASLDNRAPELVDDWFAEVQP